MEISGVADYVTAAMVNGGYGEIAGPLYSPDGKTSIPNKLDQPRIQTTTTQFHLFALPGKSYEVTLFRGDKREKHLVTVTAQ